MGWPSQAWTIEIHYMFLHIYVHVNLLSNVRTPWAPTDVESTYMYGQEKVNSPQGSVITELTHVYMYMYGVINLIQLSKWCKHWLYGGHFPMNVGLKFFVCYSSTGIVSNAIIIINGSAVLEC